MQQLNTIDINSFTEKYINYFQNEFDPNTEAYYEFFDSMDFPNDCRTLGFVMDCGDCFATIYGVDAWNTLDGLKSVIDIIDKPEIIGAALYSKWRYFNHWSESHSTETDKEWFLALLYRLKYLAGRQEYYFPFGEVVHKVVQLDRTPKKVFVLGVYASAVHATWSGGEVPRTVTLAVASEPRIFWDGNPEEAAEIINRIKVPEGLGKLEPADNKYNGPSAKILDEQILAPLGYSRKDAWLCDLLPETRLNDNQINALKDTYEIVREEYGLNEVTIPECPNQYCDSERCQEILAEIEESQADLLILLGDAPIKQFLKKVAKVPYSSLNQYVKLYGYGNATDVLLNDHTIKVLPFAHPRQIGALGYHSQDWYKKHQEWEKSLIT